MCAGEGKPLLLSGAAALGAPIQMVPWSSVCAVLERVLCGARTDAFPFAAWPPSVQHLKKGFRLGSSGAKR